MKKYFFAFNILFLSLTLLNYTTFCKAEEIIFKSPKHTSSFNYKWVSTETGKQDVELLFPSDRGAHNPDRSDVIEWSWNKTKSKWAGWGMQWKGWNKPINFSSIVKHRFVGEELTSKIAKEFSRCASNFELQFKVKGYISNSFHKDLLWVKFDGIGDVPSKEIKFLYYIKDKNGETVELSSETFHEVKIPLNEFKIIRSRINPTRIKQITFGTPTVQKTDGKIYLYDIKISKIR